jgi:hypothetical protein
MMKAIFRFLAISSVILAMAAPAFANANVVVINNDGPGEGFNDPTPVAPIGGNAGTTKGLQRQIAFVYAANQWAQTIDSNVTIYVVAAFNPLGANVLGSAGAWDVFSDFTPTAHYAGPEFAQTWYSSALADKRAGHDNDETSPDINAQFSSDFDFYLGLDNNHGAKNDLVAVLLHELAHGLGFQTFVGKTTGQNFGGFTDNTVTPPRFYPQQTDVYARHMLDLTQNFHWSDPNLLPADRLASITRYGNVVWDGAQTTAALPSVLSFGSPEVRVTAPAAIAGVYQFGTAAFGPVVANPGVSGFLVRALDDANSAGPATTDGCTALTNAAAVNGNIALVERGTCGFAVKAKIAQDAGATAVIIYNNAANVNAAAPGMADDGINGPNVHIPTVSLNRRDGLAVVGQTGVSVKISVDQNVRAGADPGGRGRLYMPFPIASGSSASHWDTVAFRNLLMEPAINADLTHSVKPPEDLTLTVLRDIGWYADADVDGIEDSSDNCKNTANGDQANWDGDSQGDACDLDDDNDGVADTADAFPHSSLSATVVIGGRDSGAPDAVRADGARFMDLLPAVQSAAKTHGDFVSGVTSLANDFMKAGLFTGAQKGAIVSAAAGASIP